MAEGSVARLKPQVLAWVLVGQRFVVWADTPDLDGFLDEVVAFVEARLTAPVKPRRAG